MAGGAGLIGDVRAAVDVAAVISVFAVVVGCIDRL